MNFDSSALHFVILMTAAALLLFADLFLWLRGKQTFSQTVWKINQFTLALAFTAGVIAGHLFSVPG